MKMAAGHEHGGDGLLTQIDGGDMVGFPIFPKQTVLPSCSLTQRQGAARLELMIANDCKI